MKNPLEIHVDWNSFAEPKNIPEPTENAPAVIFFVGMAGTGKSTLVGSLAAELELKDGKTPYLVNLDPAVLELSYKPNIDIRDSIKYKKLMRKHGLGPNGAIIAAINLFTTKFKEVLNYVQKKSNSVDYVFIDTPGQIEVFTWSAAGKIMTSMSALHFPTAIAYCVEAPRCAAPATLISSLLYGTSITLASKLPSLFILTKCDEPLDVDIETLIRDNFAFLEYTDKYPRETYSLDLARSLSLSLSEFYSDVAIVKTSVSQDDPVPENYDQILEGFQKVKNEYFRYFRNLIKEVSCAIDSKQQEDADNEFLKFNKAVDKIG